MSVPCLFAIEFGVLEFWLCRSVLGHSINKRIQSQGLPIDISVQLQACFCSYTCSSWPLKQGRMGDLSQLKEDLEQKITTWQRKVDLKLMKSVWGAV